MGLFYGFVYGFFWEGLGLVGDLASINGGVVGVFGACQGSSGIKYGAYLGGLFIHRLAINITYKVGGANLYVYGVDDGTTRLWTIRGFGHAVSSTLGHGEGCAT